MPTAKKKPARKPAPRRARRSAPHFHLPTLEQRQLDLIGLGARRPRPVLRVPRLRGLGRRARRLAGRRRAALAARRRRTTWCRSRWPRRGAILMLRPVLPAVRPFRAGAICLFLAVTLGLSAGHAGRRAGRRAARTGGTRSGSRPAAGWWGRRSTGSSTTLLGDVGAHILAVFLFIAGVLLLTGASVAGVIKATSDSVSTTTRELRDAVVQAPRPRPRARRRRPGDARAVHARARRSAPEVFGETPEFDDAQAQAGGEEEARPGRGRELLVGRGALPGPLRRRAAVPEPEPRARGRRARGRGRRRARAPGRGPGRGRGGRHARPGRARRSRAAHAPGPLPPRGHRLARLRLGAAGPGQAHALDRGRRRARTPPGRRRSPRS